MKTNDENVVFAGERDISEVRTPATESHRLRQRESTTISEPVRAVGRSGTIGPMPQRGKFVAEGVPEVSELR